MDIIQQAATMALLTLVVYFVMVNIVDRGQAIQTTGNAQEAITNASSTFKKTAEHVARGIRSELGISNRLNVEANNSVPIEGINTTVGVHSRTTVGEPVHNGENNLTALSVYDEQAKGVLPVNHDLFEKPSDFGSDITNISQFYRNNPDLFDKSMNGGAYVPDVTQWNTQGKELYDNMSQHTHQGPVQGYNYKDPTFPAMC